MAFTALQRAVLEVTEWDTGGALVTISSENLELNVYLKADELDEWREAFGYEV